MVDMQKGMDMAVGVFVTLLLAAALIPVAFDLIFNASTSSWTNNTETLWDLIPLISIVAVLLLFVGWANSAGGQ